MSIRRALILSPLILAALFAAAYFALVYWLESAGGRQALEKTMADRIGMPVSLGGDFDIRLLPSVGVSGTQLLVSDPVTGEELATGNYYETDLALAPLFREELEIRHVLIEGLKLKLPDGNGLFFPRISVGAFAFNRPTDFEVDWSWMGRLDGQFAWHPEESRLWLDALWRVEDRDEIAYRGDIVIQPGKMSFADSELIVGDQAVNGEGCLLLDGGPELNLLLAADRLDLDALLENIPAGQGDPGSLPVQLNLRLDAAEIRRGGIVARETRLEVGGQPSCR